MSTPRRWSSSSWRTGRTLLRSSRIGVTSISSTSARGSMPCWPTRRLETAPARRPRRGRYGVSPLQSDLHLGWLSRTRLSSRRARGRPRPCHPAMVSQLCQWALARYGLRTVPRRSLNRTLRLYGCSRRRVFTLWVPLTQRTSAENAAAGTNASSPTTDRCQQRARLTTGESPAPSGGRPGGRGGGWEPESQPMNATVHGRTGGLSRRHCQARRRHGSSSAIRLDERMFQASRGLPPIPLPPWRTSSTRDSDYEQLRILADRVTGEDCDAAAGPNHGFAPEEVGARAGLPRGRRCTPGCRRRGSPRPEEPRAAAPRGRWYISPADDVNLVWVLVGCQHVVAVHCDG